MSPDAVSLVVIHHGVPAVGVTVYFLDADGSVALATVTDGHREVGRGGAVAARRSARPPAFTPLAGWG
jgi:hypothetical protein